MPTGHPQQMGRAPDSATADGAVASTTARGGGGTEPGMATPGNGVRERACLTGADDARHAGELSTRRPKHTEHPRVGGEDAWWHLAAGVCPTLSSCANGELDN
ncbi:hypothetical protein GCM10010423_43750 [Streptomyces levis]|uniref:Uncharacterized protein n=1 Tax=Streptomyces levis TaxID=285566 RepID=A0ABN3NVH2_9ACTN